MELVNTFDRIGGTFDNWLETSKIDQELGYDDDDDRLLIVDQKPEIKNRFYCWRMNDWILIKDKIIDQTRIIREILN